MMKKLDAISAARIEQALAEKRDWMQLRALAKELALEPLTVIAKEHFELMFRFAMAKYNPSDKGRAGKSREFIDRLKATHANYAYYREFHARPHKSHDISYKHTGYIEEKAGAGAWLYSSRNNEYADILQEYRSRNERIHWHVKTRLKTAKARDTYILVHFNILCTWGQLFDYLEQYNGKMESWLKPQVKYCDESREYRLDMQEFNTSLPKVQYLLACPYNRLRTKK